MRICCLCVYTNDTPTDFYFHRLISNEVCKDSVYRCKALYRRKLHATRERKPGVLSLNAFIYIAYTYRICTNTGFKIILPYFFPKSAKKNVPNTGIIQCQLMGWNNPPSSLFFLHSNNEKVFCVFFLSSKESQMSSHLFIKTTKDADIGLLTERILLIKISWYHRTCSDYASEV